MAILSKPIKIAVAGTVLFFTWAVWYDNYRRSKPDYKEKLVEKRKEELRQKRILNDPLYHVKNLPLYEGDVSDMAGTQRYMMEMMQEGEAQLVPGGDVKKGCAMISIGMSYIPLQQRQMAFAQLAQALPQEVVMLLQKMIPVAAGRVQSQRVQKMFGAKGVMTGAGDIKDSSKLPKDDLIKEVGPGVGTNLKKVDDDGPDDVDSIDGDSEEAKIVELESEEAKVVELPVDKQEEDKDADTGSKTHKQIEEDISDQPEKTIDHEKSSPNLVELPEPVQEEPSAAPEETPIEQTKIAEQSEHEVLKLEPEDADIGIEEYEPKYSHDQVQKQVENTNKLLDEMERKYPELAKTKVDLEAETQAILDDSQPNTKEEMKKSADESSSSSGDEEDEEDLD